MKTGKRHREEAGGRLSGPLSLLAGTGLAAGVSLLVLYGIAAAVAGQLLSSSAMDYGPLAACLLGAVLGSAYCVRGKGRAAPLWGLGLGMGLFLLLLAYSLWSTQELPSGGRLLTVCLPCLCGGGLTGFLARGGKRGRTRGKRA